MNVSLILMKPSGQTKTFPLKGLTIIGRRSDCDLQIPLEEISRRHCQVNIDNSSVLIRDLGSTNGTLVNGSKIDDQLELNPGDTLTLGPLTFNINIEGAPKHIAPVPPAPAVENEAAQADLSEETAIDKSLEPQKPEAKAGPQPQSNQPQESEVFDLADETAVDQPAETEKSKQPERPATKPASKPAPPQDKDELSLDTGDDDSIPSLSDSELFGTDTSAPSASGTQILKDLLGEDEDTKK